MTKIVLNPVTQTGSLAASTNFELPEPFAYYGFAVQLKITQIGSIAGTLKAEVSNDEVTWFDYVEGTFASEAVTGSDDIMWFVADQIVPFKHMRINWAHTSGDGTLSAIVSGVRV